MDLITALRLKTATIEKDLATIASGSVEGVSQVTLDFKVKEGVEILTQKCLDFTSDSVVLEVGLRALAELLIPLYQAKGFTVALEPVAQQDLLFTFTPAVEFGQVFDTERFQPNDSNAGMIEMIRWQRSRICGTDCERLVAEALMANPAATEVIVPAGSQAEADFLAARAIVRGCNADVVESGGVYSMRITLPPLN